MNSSNNTNDNTTATGFYLSEDQWLTIFGSTWPLDIFMFYPYLVVGLLGIILNAYSMAVFLDSEFTIDLYKYMRVYCLNNMAFCIFGTCNCFINTKRLFPWTNSYFTNAYSAYFYIPTASVLSFFGSMLDIFVLLDRIGNFNNRVKARINWPVYKTCLATIIACFLFNVPFYLAYCPISLTVMLNQTTAFTIWYGGNSDYFGKQLIGTIWLAFFLVVRDFGVMVAQLALNIVSIVLLKRYLEKKKTRFETATTQRPSIVNNNRVETAVSNHVRESHSNLTHSAVNQNNMSGVGTGVGNSLRSSVTLRQVKKEKISSADQKATVIKKIIYLECELFYLS
jgi:hypothetical protein